METVKLERRKKNGLEEKLNPSSNPKKVERPKELPCKEFILRNSTLTNLWDKPHTRLLYNICIAFFFLSFSHIAIFYWLNPKRFHYDISVAVGTFGKLHIVAAVWVSIHVSILGFLYPVFRFWATTRIHTNIKGVYDSVFLVLFIMYEAALVVFPARVVVDYNLPLVSSFTLLAEQARLFMKTLAFVRENITRALAYKPHEDRGKDSGNSKVYPPLENLIYFLFAPTLVYRDNYPRTPRIRWSLVGWNFLNFFLLVTAGYVPWIFFYVNIFNKTWQEPISLAELIGILSVSNFAGSFAMTVYFIAMLHSWLNAFAEMLRFGDRLFYDDWWNSTSFTRYYRSWNTVIHDWLYSYIYRDMYTLFGRNRTIAMFTVFLISAVIHEYILSLCLKFVFPLLFITFSISATLFVFITRGTTSSIWNIFLLGCLFQGWGICSVFYGLEWYARLNCPKTMDSWLDYVVPRSFTCNIVSFT